jgi:hypothetical protein
VHISKLTTHNVNVIKRKQRHKWTSIILVNAIKRKQRHKWTSIILSLKVPSGTMDINTKLRKMLRGRKLVQKLLIYDPGNWTLNEA